MLTDTLCSGFMHNPVVLVVTKQTLGEDGIALQNRRGELEYYRNLHAWIIPLQLFSTRSKFHGQSLCKCMHKTPSCF